jgi:hypothetical protein
VQIIFVVPPTYEPLLQGKRSGFDKYVEMIRAGAGNPDLWIDFTSPEYVDLRKKKENFVDGVHFVSAAAQQIVAGLNSFVNHALEGGRLSVPRRGK